MSVQREIDRISQNIENTYHVLDALCCEVPENKTSDNLATTAGTAKVVLYKEQVLTEEQKKQVRTNIDAVGSDELVEFEEKIPNKTSQLTNNSGFITKAVNDLANYYLKSQTYSAEEIDNKISTIPKFSIEVVTSLPTTNISNTTVYLIASGNEQDNLYTEYIYINGKWEYLGKQTVDLSGYVKRTELSSYYTKTEIDSLLQTIRNSIPTKLSQMTADATHRTVTDTEKQTWNNKSNFSGAFKDLTGKPTTLAGYGITDGATKTDVSQLQETIVDLKSSGISADLKSALKTYFNNMQTLFTQLAYTTESHIGATLVQNAKNIVTALESVTVEPETEVTVSQNGSTLILSSVDAITTISQSGNTLVLA